MVMIKKLREIAAKAGKNDDDIFTILRCFNEILDVLEYFEREVRNQVHDDDCDFDETQDNTDNDCECGLLAAEHVLEKLRKKVSETGVMNI